MILETVTASTRERQPREKDVFEHFEPAKGATKTDFPSFARITSKNPGVAQLHRVLLEVLMFAPSDSVFVASTQEVWKVSNDPYQGSFPILLNRDTSASDKHLLDLC